MSILAVLRLTNGFNDGGSGVITFGQGALLLGGFNEFPRPGGATSTDIRGTG